MICCCRFCLISARSSFRCSHSCCYILVVFCAYVWDLRCTFHPFSACRRMCIMRSLSIHDIAGCRSATRVSCFRGFSVSFIQYRFPRCLIQAEVQLFMRFWPGAAISCVCSKYVSVLLISAFHRGFPP